jgi:hypothetical protein
MNNVLRITVIEIRFTVDDGIDGIGRFGMNIETSSPRVLELVGVRYSAPQLVVRKARLSAHC